MDPLPEYGGPHLVPEEDFPVGWSNRPPTPRDDEAFVCLQHVFRYHRIFWRLVLLLRVSSTDGTKTYWIPGSVFYSSWKRHESFFWNSTSEIIWETHGAEGVRGILEALACPSIILKLLPAEHQKGGCSKPEKPVFNVEKLKMEEIIVGCLFN